MKHEDLDVYNLRSIYIKWKEEESLFTSSFFPPTNFHVGCGICAEGKKETFKEKIQFDDEKKTSTHVGIEGQVFNYYKSYKATWQEVPRNGGPDVAKVIIEYEKLSESMPHPVSYLDLMANWTKDLDAHLVKA